MRSENAPRAIVVDTNLFVSGLINSSGLPRRLLSAWYDEAYTLLVSDAIIAEYERVLFRSEFRQRFGLSPRTVNSFLIQVRDRGIRVVPLPELALPVTVRDEDDRHILAAALGGGATHVVTGDQDLLTLDGHPALGTLRIVTARAFLDLLPVP